MTRTQGHQDYAKEGERHGIQPLRNLRRESRGATVQYEPCNYCKATPFNKDDLEYGGTCDKPNGSRGWACARCFGEKYFPQKDWEIPNWALRFVDNHDPGECLEQLRWFLFRIGTYSPIDGFSDKKQETIYLRAEVNYRAEVNRVLSRIPSNPYMIHRSIEELARLLDARNSRRFKYRQLHEHELRGALHYPWMALSIGRAMEKLLWRYSWGNEPDYRSWSETTANGWKLSAWKQPDGSGWRWQAKSPVEMSTPPRETFNGLEQDEESAKKAAEEKSRTWINPRK